MDLMFEGCLMLSCGLMITTEGASQLVALQLDCKA